MLTKGCVGYLAIVDTTKKVVTELSDVHVVLQVSRCVSEGITRTATGSRD